MAGRSTEANDGGRGQETILSRRNFLIGLGGLSVVAATGTAAYLALRNNGRNESSKVEPVKLPAEATPQEKTAIITNALNEGRSVADVEIAVGYTVNHRFQDPTTGTASQNGYNAGILNPLVLGKHTYGYTTYDQATGRARVSVVQENSPLTVTGRPEPYDPNAPVTTPHIGAAEVSRVYYERNDKSRFYFTAMDRQPGSVAYGDPEPIRVGEPLL